MSAKKTTKNSRVDRITALEQELKKLKATKYSIVETEDEENEEIKQEKLLEIVLKNKEAQGALKKIKGVLDKANNLTISFDCEFEVEDLGIRYNLDTALNQVESALQKEENRVGKIVTPEFLKIEKIIESESKKHKITCDLCIYDILEEQGI